MQFSCALFHDLLCQLSSFFFILHCFTTHLAGDCEGLRGVIKNYGIAFSPHIDYMSLLNLETVALMVSEKHCLDMPERRTDRQTDKQTWSNQFFSSNTLQVLTCLLQPVIYIVPKLIQPLFLLKRNRAQKLKVNPLRMY